MVVTLEVEVDIGAAKSIIAWKKLIEGTPKDLRAHKMKGMGWFYLLSKKY